MADSNTLHFTIKVEPSTNSVSLANSGPMEADPLVEKDVYVLLQGPAHITPKAGADKGITVIFLDEAGNPTKSPLTFTFKDDPNPDLAFKQLKIMSLQIIIECDKMKYEELKQQDKLKNYFPTVYNEIVETPTNARLMNSTDPPFN